MPGNLLSADTSFPTFTPEQTNEQKLDVVTNYLYMLLEQLRYTMANLGAGTQDDPITAARGMEYTYGLYYRDPEDGLVYLCERIGEAEGGKIVLQYLPHELAGQYFEEVTAGA